MRAGPDVTHGMHRIRPHDPAKKPVVRLIVCMGSLGLRKIIVISYSCCIAGEGPSRTDQAGDKMTDERRPDVCYDIHKVHT